MVVILNDVVDKNGPARLCFITAVAIHFAAPDVHIVVIVQRGFHGLLLST